MKIHFFYFNIPFLPKSCNVELCHETVHRHECLVHDLAHLRQVAGLGEAGAELGWQVLLGGQRGNVQIYGKVDDIEGASIGSCSNSFAVTLGVATNPLDIAL